MADTILRTKSKGRAAEQKQTLALVQGRLIVLRPVAAHDLPVFKRWDDDPVVMQWMGRKFAESTAEDWLATTGADRNCRALAIETLEGRLIGDLELVQLNWRTGTGELRIRIGEKDCWSKGFGTDAVLTGLKLAFASLGLTHVYLRVFSAHTRAVALYERVGFRRDAILGPIRRRHDPAPVILMSITRQRWQKQASQSA